MSFKNIVSISSFEKTISISFLHFAFFLHSSSQKKILISFSYFFDFCFVSSHLFFSKDKFCFIFSHAIGDLYYFFTSRLFKRQFLLHSFTTYSHLIFSKDFFTIPLFKKIISTSFLLFLELRRFQTRVDFYFLFFKSLQQIFFYNMIINCCIII